MPQFSYVTVLTALMTAALYGAAQFALAKELLAVYAAAGVIFAARQFAKNRSR